MFTVPNSAFARVGEAFGCAAIDEELPLELRHIGHGTAGRFVRGALIVPPADWRVAAILA
jgi:hypothetical protein